MCFQMKSYLFLPDAPFSFFSLSSLSFILIRQSTQSIHPKRRISHHTGDHSKMMLAPSIAPEFQLVWCPVDKGRQYCHQTDSTHVISERQPEIAIPMRNLFRA